MTETIYLYIFYGGAILSAIMFVTTIVLFFILKIPYVIGDLTGANARKAIENIRNQNESTGEKVYKSSQTNLKRGKVTDKISASGNLLNSHSENLAGAMATEKISNDVVDFSANETTVLECTEETTLLDSNNETTVLSQLQGETVVLEQTDSYESVFTVEYEITFIHTSEVIAL